MSTVGGRGSDMVRRGQYVVVRCTDHASGTPLDAAAVLGRYKALAPAGDHTKPGLFSYSTRAFSRSPSSELLCQDAFNVH